MKQSSLKSTMESIYMEKLKENWLKLWNHYWWILLAIFVIFRLVYLWQQNVPSLNQDESAILLNARLLAQSGHDEWGQSWPTVFKSFGDYKLPGYIYLTAVLGKVIGWHNWTVRLPSFAAGILLTPLVYAITKQWFNKSAARLAAVLVVASPWSWHYSSVGFEANVGLMEFLVSWWLLTRQTKKEKISLLVGLLVLLAAMLTYNSPLLLSPLLLIAIWWVWGLRRRRWRITLAASLGWLIVFALALSVTLPVTAQKTGISIFSDPRILLDYPLYRQQFNSDWTQTLLGNRYLYFVLIMIKNWISSWSFNFLVSGGGDNPWHTIPGQGHLHFLIWLAAPWGVVSVIYRTWQQKKVDHLLALVVLGASLLPAIITVDAPHATRSLLFFVLLTIFAAKGLAEAASLVPERWKFVWLFGLGSLLFFGWLAWWGTARSAWSSQVSDRWQIGLAEAIASVPNNNQLVYVQDSFGTLYTYVANTKQIPVTTFFATVSRSGPDTAGLFKVESVERFKFVADLPTGVDSGYYLYPQSKTKWAMIEL